MSPRSRLLVTLTTSLGLAALAPGAAQAEPPANDTAASALEFATITAENGVPNERQGIAELVEAAADTGVPRCLGTESFDRTVWFRVAPAATPRELSVEASGRTLAVLDLAAFVQPEGATAAVTTEPNACSGVGAGAADAGEEPTAGVALHVPAGRSVLVQVGRRGARGSAEDERAVVSLGTKDLFGTVAPAGDVADAFTPAFAGRGIEVPLGGATLTEEDPAQPPCPSLGSVWRRVVPGRSGTRNVVAGGGQVGTLSVFAGDRPTGDDALGCVNRERSSGDLALSVRATRGVPLWIRLGTDRPPADAVGTLAIDDGPPVRDGGPGGSPPVLGDPPPEVCPPPRYPPRPELRGVRIRFAPVVADLARLERTRRLVVTVARLTGRPRLGRVVLVGPCSRVAARSTLVRLRTGRRVVLTLTGRRELARGRYGLQATVVDRRGRRVDVRTIGSVRLR